MAVTNLFSEEKTLVLQFETRAFTEHSDSQHHKSRGGSCPLDATLDQAGGLTDPVTQEVQLRTANNPVTLHDNVSDLGAVDGECTLNTFTVDNATNGEHLTNPASTLGNDHAGEELNTFFVFVTVENTGMHFDIVTNVEFQWGFTQIGLLCKYNKLVHDVSES